MEKEKIIMTESIEKIVNANVNVDLENLTEQEFIQLINGVKGLNATLTESGQIKVRQILLG